MVGHISNRRGAARPARRVENNKAIRSNYGNIKKKIVAKAVNQARRNGVRPSLLNETRPERPRIIRQRGPGIEKRLELEASGSKLPAPRRRGRRRGRGEKPPDMASSVSKLQEERPRGRARRPMAKPVDMEPSGSKMPERPVSRVVRPNFGGRPRPAGIDKLELEPPSRPLMKNNVPRRDDGRRRDRGPTRIEKRPGIDAPSRMARRSPPQPFPDERRHLLHRDSPPGHHPMHFPIRDEPHRMRHEEPRAPLMRRSPPRQLYPPRGREEIRGHRDSPMLSLEKEPMFYERFKEAPPRGRMPESSRSLPTPAERDSLQRRRRPPRHLRTSRTERDEELVKRPRDGPSRQPDKHYGHMESPRMLPRDLDVLHRRPAPERGPHYPGRGMERPPIGLDYPRARSITPPSLRLMKAFPPRGHIRELESDLRLMRSGRRDEFPHGREPIHPPFEFGRERVRMEPYDIPDFRVRMLPSRRSMEREIERRDREWHPPPLPRLAGSVSTRGRSAERNSRYNMPGSSYHFDPLSRR